MKKRVRKYNSPKRVRVGSRKWALLGILVLLLTIPMTIALVAQSQDIRQEAATTYVASTQITTMPTDTLKITISKEDGTTQENNSGSQKGNTTSPDESSNDQSGGSEDCTTEDTTNKSVGGMMRTINIHCDGQDQNVDESGSDGNTKVIKSGGEDGQVSQPKNTKSTKDIKAGKNDKTGKKPKKSKNFIQQFIDMILNRQANR